MASRETLEKALKNPNVRQFLDLLAYTEGTQGNGYHTAFGGGRLKSLADHPRYLKTFKQTNGKTNKTSAAGRYQFLRGTWDGLAKQYGFDDFGERNQDLGAIALLAQNGALPYVLKGDWNNAIAKSGRTWASLPTSPHPQPTKSWKKVQRFMAKYDNGDVSPTRNTNPKLFERPETVSVESLQALYTRPEAIPVAQLKDKKAQLQDFARPSTVNAMDLQPTKHTQPQPSQQPKGFGTFETIASELPKLKAQGLNPYQAMYSLAQRQDKVGESIRTAYKQGMGAEQLSNYFKVDELWTSNQPSTSASSKPDKQVSPTALSM